MEVEEEENEVRKRKGREAEYQMSIEMYIYCYNSDFLIAFFSEARSRSWWRRVEADSKL